jgi:hypothetical protein
MLCWREQGRNDFSEAERTCRLELSGGELQSLTIPVNDTISDFRICPDDQQRADGGYATMFQLGMLSMIVRPVDQERLLQQCAAKEVPLPVVPSESHGVRWHEGTATCAHPTINEPPYIQFALKQPTLVGGVRLCYAYPAATGPSQFSLFWRERGRNDFLEEHSCRLMLPAAAQSQSMIVPVNDTITDLRIYPDDTQRPGGYACVFRLDQLRLLVRSGTASGLARNNN